MAMKIANIAEFKNHLSAYLDAVANGEVNRTGNVGERMT